METEQETKSLDTASPPAYWPAIGRLARGEFISSVLIKRIGIVGRTGSGKSSLTLSLLRCLLTEGEVYYDGLLTSSIALEALRSSITIIPQVPDLLNGSVRQNLDPFDQFEDGISDDGRLTLDTPVTTGGTNLSVGQRQIIALARAMVRESKLLILDEDHKTDAVIQKTLREMKGVTQLIVAHRLQTIMDADRIVVLDAGHIVEFDSPRRLLQRDAGMFRALVDASRDRDALLALIQDLE
ncbi:P-loop containing nucleoside triphosphate hydrolase protein [Melanogaster broomeanus]|nr:P-loop containing nucleoside triphosphate hydrolase protein [Melanogaster broomeanus]